MKAILHQQNMMRALRVEMGWPRFKPANDCLAFTAGKPIKVATGMEIARIATMLGKDVIYSGWSSTKAAQPVSFALAYREMLSVDVVDRLVPYAANDTALLTLVSIRTDEYFAIDQRGSLVRVPGRPKDVRKGRERAMQRIRATAAAMDDTLLSTNRFVPTGQDWIEPDTAQVETIIRFA